jgi:hypothetical protein
MERTKDRTVQRRRSSQAATDCRNKGTDADDRNNSTSSRNKENDPQ